MKGYVIMVNYGVEGWRIKAETDNYKEIGRLWYEAIRASGGVETRAFSAMDSVSVTFGDDATSEAVPSRAEVEKP